ncbi:hypothetical protein ACWOE5_01885 [Aerococcus sanguinicola]|uniref:Uncharacterized protein n=1 Tax=Aerococcus sanguinicola TaxID=119206 RepID=A0A120I9F9_9LACT|nr:MULTISPECIES: hypothetical protein [Aerococcus]AMB94763.1 hypothetical protein AWM72_08335 [Aerococcus sanguinicola]MDK7049532.1 hypothetical protein [Aerococcus sanguinicola]OFT96514.1 hypothetical protein HMPREF3090_02665 [Aerococcus sp. HMSC23C02]PKZ23236.1 hypothetical protein CYJ28_01420 [Aerococcus sanguinicola]
MVKFNQHFDNPDQLKAFLRQEDRPDLELEYLEVQDELEELAAGPVSRENHRQQLKLETYRDALVEVLNEKPIEDEIRSEVEEEESDDYVEEDKQGPTDSSMESKGAAFLSGLGQQVKRGVQASGQAINRGIEHEMAKKEPWKEKKAALAEERQRAKEAKEAQALANQAQYKPYPRKRRRGCGCGGCLLVIVLALVLGYFALGQAQVYLPNISLNAPDIRVDGGSLIQEGWEYAKSWLGNLFSGDDQAPADEGQGWQAPADNGGGSWQNQEAPATDNGWTEPAPTSPDPAPQAGDETGTGY